MALGPAREWTPKSTASYHNALLHARRYFTRRKVGRIRPSDLMAFRAHLSSDAVPTLKTRGSVAWVMQATHAVLQLAVQDRALPSNPATGVSRTQGKAGRAVEDTKRYLDADQVDAIADELQPPWDTLVRFAAWTGLRAGELAGLNVSDVTLWQPESGVGWEGEVRVSRTRRKVNGGWDESTPKSGKGRTVALIDFIAEELHEHIESYSLTDESPLFPGRKLGGDRPGEVDWSKPVEMNSFYQNIFRPAVRRAGLGNVRVHDLRHTYASLMLTYEQTAWWISEQLGHADYTITLRTYARLIKPANTAAHPLSGRGLRPAATGSNVVPLHQRSTA